MAALILLRHARSTANGAGVLAGRGPGVGLDPTGVEQARALPERLAGCPVTRLVSSPLERCLDTLRPLAAARGMRVDTDARLTEVDYGQWTGRPLAELREEPGWRMVQQHPASMIFPGGEAFAAVSARAVAAARHYAATCDGGAVVICSHGDVIAAILADALGMHLDLIQRLTIAPASASVVRYGPTRPVVELINGTGPLGEIWPAAQEDALGGSTGTAGGIQQTDGRVA